MHNFKKILVGVEYQPREMTIPPGTRKAVEQAVWLAKHTGGQMTLLHSAWSDAYAESIGGGGEITHEGLSAECRAALDALVAGVRSEGVTCELTLSTERPWLALTHAVMRGEADVVVVGKRDNEDDARKLGSVATKLLRKCPSPVWVVKVEHDLVHKLVLAATDLTQVGDRAVRYGAYVASKHGFGLHVVHAYQVPFQLQMEASRISEEEYADQLSTIKQAAIDEIQKILEGAELAEEPVLHVGRNTPSIAIREAVEHLHPDLLVMGTISRGGIAGFLVGNTAEKLLDRVDCSILTIKPVDFVTPVELPKD